MENASRNQSTVTQIQDELQWSENYFWSYCPEEYEENGDGEKAIQEESYENCYELYLEQGEVGYTFRAMNLSKKEWYDFLEGLLLTADLHWEVRDAYVDTVFPALTFARERSGKDCWWLQFDGVLLPMEWYHLISCNNYESGLRICGDFR